MKKVLLSQKIRDEGLEMLKGNAEVIIAPDPSQNTIAKLIKDVHGVILRTTSKITREMIKSAPHLEVISRTGAGVDNVDVQAASECGVMVCNLPGLNRISVAEHTVSLILAVAKALPFLDGEVRKANWKSRNEYKPVELHQKTLGVIGFGKIGSSVATIMSGGFGMKILAYDPYVSKSQDLPLPQPLPPGEGSFSAPPLVGGVGGGGDLVFCELEELLSRADFVTAHLPATSETEKLLNKEHLFMMKPSACFINTARGSVVDESALIELLQNRRIAGAGLDVFEKEPLPPDHPLIKLNNVILSPHAAALTKECVVRAAVEAAKAVIDVFSGREPKHMYNKSD